MVQLEREPAPDFWMAERQQEWTARWQAKHGQSWEWPQYQNRRLNEHIVAAMRPWHYHKCAFCEGDPEHLEIEHFATKTSYRELAIGEWWSLVRYHQSSSFWEMANGPSDLKWIARYIQQNHSQCAELVHPAHPYSLMCKCVLERYAPKLESHEN